MGIHRQPACIPEFLDTDIPPAITDRDDAIRHLLRELIRLGRIPDARFHLLLEGLITRESIGSTAIGRGIAIPHVRVSGLDDFHVARGHSGKGVAWPGAAAGQAVHFVYLVLSPNDRPSDHLRLLEYLSRTAGTEAG